MKTLVFGDTHGRRLWQRMVATEEFDRVIFIGDYFDSWDVGPELQIENFKDICAFQASEKELGKEVIMLIGNHDFHYLKQAGNEHYSGYNHGYASSIAYLLTEHLPNMQICYKDGDFLFSHAGLTETWCKESGVDQGDIQNSVNELFKTNPEKFRFNGWEETGDNITQGPLWVRPRSLFEDQIKNVTQFVGHTQVKQIVFANSGFYLIDAIAKDQYILIVDGEVQVIQAEPLPKKPFIKYEDL